jgi:hypothetical protein
MKTISRAITMTLSAGILVTMFVSNASAGCGDLASLQGPFEFPQQRSAAQSLAKSMESENALARGGGSSSASIVGLWKMQLLSKGNTTHNPSIPDGAMIDFGYTQWHSDGTEILNSGGHAPATGNFCLGVWGQTGFLTFELNHFPIAYDATTGAIANYIQLQEQDTLSPSGDSYTGTFTLNIFDTKGNQVDHLTGTVVATRLTVDSTLPSAAADN